MTWHDTTDPHAGEASYPHNFCLGCGTISPNAKADMRHVTACTERPVRTVSCWSCGTENWKRTACRCCGKDLR